MIKKLKQILQDNIDDKKVQLYSFGFHEDGFAYWKGKRQDAIFEITCTGKIAKQIFNGMQLIKLLLAAK